MIIPNLYIYICIYKVWLQRGFGPLYGPSSGSHNLSGCLWRHTHGFAWSPTGEPTERALQCTLGWTLHHLGPLWYCLNWFALDFTNKLLLPFALFFVLLFIVFVDFDAAAVYVILDSWGIFSVGHHTCGRLV